MTLEATLYMQPGCHLCEDALTELERLQVKHPHSLRLVDIRGDPGLVRRYGERIPVLELGGRQYAAPLPRAVLERALKEASMLW
jgi:hypothetical protein